jgi:ribosomal protein L27
MTFKAGENAGLGHDYTVFAKIDGTVHIEHETRQKKRIRIEALAGE